MVLSKAKVTHQTLAHLRPTKTVCKLLVVMLYCFPYSDYIDQLSLTPEDDFNVGRDSYK